MSGIIKFETEPDEHKLRSALSEPAALIIWQKTRVDAQRQAERLLQKIIFDRDLPLVLKLIDNYGQAQTAIYLSKDAYGRERFHPRQFPAVTVIHGTAKEYRRWREAQT